MKKVMHKMVAALRRWEGVCTEENALKLREVIPRIEARIRKPTTVTRGLSWSSTAQPTTSWGTSQEGQAVSSSSFGASLVSDVVAADVSVS